jgi:hypothetical protein
LLQNSKRSLRWESAEVALNLSGRCAVPNGAYYHLIYALATENRSAIPCLRQSGRCYINRSTFATVGCDVFLQAGYGHCHLVRQVSFLLPRELPQAEQAAHAITAFLELSFEPSMLWATHSIGRREAHQAPVENVEEQCSRKANKRQILFSFYFRL